MHVAETRNVSVVSQRLCMSLATNFVARYKVSEVDKLGATEECLVVAIALVKETLAECVT